MRRALCFVCFQGALAGLLAVFLAAGSAARLPHLAAKRQLVQHLQLTDLALWSEAHYTRHPTQSDGFTPFQDHPGAFDHFPAGSIVGPVSPRPPTTLHLRRRGPVPCSAP